MSKTMLLAEGKAGLFGGKWQKNDGGLGVAAIRFKVNNIEENVGLYLQGAAFTWGEWSLFLPEL